MKKKGSYEIIIRGKWGIRTTMYRKTWKGALALLTRLESECPNIWKDACEVDIYSIEEEAEAHEFLISTSN